MPSGPPELHEKWTRRGPTNCGDSNAIQFLESHGYVLTKDWRWLHPKYRGYDMSNEEYEAICYLIWEWDFGGLVT